MFRSLGKRIKEKYGASSFKEILREYAWIGGYSLRYRGEMLWYLLIGLLGTALSLGGSVLSKHIIDAVTGFNSSGILVAVIFFVLMQLFEIVVHAVSSRISTRISIRVNQQITAQVYDKLLGADWEALSAYHSGDLLTRLSGDVSAISSSVLGWLPNLFIRLLQFAGTFCIIFYYDRTLALLALLSAPVTLLMSRYAIRMMRRYNVKIRQLNSEMMVFNEESFRNIQLIKAFDRTDTYSQRHRKLQQEYMDTTMELNHFSIRKHTIMSLVGTVVTLVCFSWSIYRLWTGHITYGTMTMFLQLAGSLAATFSALVGMIPSAVGAATAAGRIMTIMELPSEDCSQAQDAAAFREKHAAEPLSVKAKDLSYHYEDGKQVLSHIDFQADGGQIVAIVGPSGEGKTTLLRLLLGIVVPKSGTLEFCAADGESISVSPATRQFCAYVAQENALFSGTIAENLRLIKPDASEEELYEVLALACADGFVRELPQGIHTPVKEQGGGFSEGQLQRICIARALLSDAPVLLMDEATSALDVQTEKKVLENIMASQKHRTCILTTHRPSVLKISHCVYQISQDRVEKVEL